jgi:hypothetical protein
MSDPETAEALVYVAPGEARIETVALPPMTEDVAEVRSLCGALSRGTERLVFEGRVPESERERMRAPFQAGEFPFPVRYGYATVGVVEDGPAHLRGRTVFALHPHQTRFRVPAGALVPLPDGVAPGRAVLAANAETALNAIWDAAPPPGARLLVVGAGLLGCLVAGILSLSGHVEVHIADTVSDRAGALSDFNVTFLQPDAVAAGYHGAFHTSATAAGLQCAIDALAFEGEVIELSWYGDAPVTLSLGGAFHSRRLAIRSSQVGQVARPRRASTTHRDRLARAVALLADARFDRLITGEVAFADLPAAIPRLLAPGAPGIATRIRY